MQTLSAIKKIHKLAEQANLKNPKKFKELSPGTKYAEFKNLFPVELEAIREIAGCYNSIGKDVLSLFIKYRDGIPLCKMCRSLVVIDRQGEYRTYCSSKCSRTDVDLYLKMANTRRNLPEWKKKETQAKKEATVLQRFGVRNVNQCPEVFAQSRETTRKRYGCDYPSQSEHVKIKVRATCQERHGGDSPFHSVSVRKVMQETNLRKYGNTNFLASELGKSLIKKSVLAKYGVSHISLCPDVQQKIRLGHKIRSKEELAITQELRRATCLEKYGVGHHFQDGVSLRKAFNTLVRFKRTKILGKIHELQGYEPVVLKSIENKLISLKTKFVEMPKIFYNDPEDGRVRRYYVDAVVETRKGNKVLIEVKSKYTLANDLEVNLQKFKSTRKWCKANGHTFALAVSNGSSVSWTFDPSLSKIRKLAE